MQGSDGFGFKPLIDKDEDLMIFEEKCMRNLKLQVLGKTGCNQYQCQKYRIADEEFDASDLYNTDVYGVINLTNIVGGPLEITNPYFTNGTHLINFNYILKYFS